MGLLQITNIPTGQGELIKVETLPLLVEPNAAFEEAKLLLEQMVQSAGSLPNSITTEEDYNRGMKILQGVTAFLKNIEEGVSPTKKRINDAKDRLMALIHELDIPANKLKLELWREEQVRLENERLAREAEKERQRKQRAAEIEALIVEIGAANQECDAATGRNQVATKEEILAGINGVARMLKSEATTAQIVSPVAEATRIRQVVALAIQHEQARIAAAQAKAEGDKKTAANILKASAKLEAPLVEEVYVPPVQTPATVAKKPDLYKAAGASVTALWRVKNIFDSARVCREHPELAEPSLSKLNDLAKRLKAKPNIAGVEWEQDVRTKGVR